MPELATLAEIVHTRSLGEEALDNYVDQQLSKRVEALCRKGLIYPALELLLRENNVQETYLELTSLLKDVPLHPVWVSKFVGSLGERLVTLSKLNLNTENFVSQLFTLRFKNFSLSGEVDFSPYIKLGVSEIGFNVCQFTEFKAINPGVKLLFFGCKLHQFKATDPCTLRGCFYDQDLVNNANIELSSRNTATLANCAGEVIDSEISYRRFQKKLGKCLPSLIEKAFRKFKDTNSLEFFSNVLGDGESIKFIWQGNLNDFRARVIDISRYGEIIEVCYRSVGSKCSFDEMIFTGFSYSISRNLYKVPFWPTLYSPEMMYDSFESWCTESKDSHLSQKIDLVIAIYSLKDLLEVTDKALCVVKSQGKSTYYKNFS